MTKTKILIVESSTIALQIMKRYLKGEAASVITAANAEDALSAARKSQPDLVYLSLSLPGMDGADCCRALKSDPELSITPVVMIANTSDEDLERCRSAGCDAVITRPVARKEFLDAGRTLMAAILRREERIPCRATVAWGWNGATVYGTIEDISLNGMYVGNSYDVALGEMLSMKFVLPWSGAALIETTARVAWLNNDRQRKKSRFPVGFGVVFPGLGVNAEEQIKDYLEFVRTRLMV